jgi:membrane-bound lytic murein transglycosylase A
MVLAACEASTVTEPSPDITVSKVSFAQLPGWGEGRPADAMGAWRRSCERLLAMAPAALLGGKVGAGTAGQWREACSAVVDFSATPAAFRALIEANFFAYEVTGKTDDRGLFTGYFEPIVRASEQADSAYNVPIHGLPSDHVTVHLKDFDPALAGQTVVGRVEGGRLRPYPARAAIAEATGPETPVLFWADDALDVFILQVQGSGIVELPDGRRQRIGFAGHNGHDYVSIGRSLIAQNELSAGAAAWQDIRGWMERNPQRVSDLLARNRRYIFFRPIDGGGAQGAAGVALTPEHSLAVDPEFLPLNVPLWLDTVHPGPGQKRLQRLVLAQDVGNAIRGPVRGDLFWGVGPEALALAGRMKSPGAYYLLLPKGIAPAT